MLPFEHELIQRLYARDEGAMEVFYARYGKTLKHTIQRLVRSEAAAEDVLQESMMKIWASFDKYDARKGRLFTWALQLSRNTAIDHLRTRHAHEAQRTQSLDHSPAWQYTTTGFLPEHVGVRELLTLLKPHDQQLMHLLYFEGYTQLEAAEELGLPLGTVKSRARAAIHVLIKATRMSQRPEPAQPKAPRLGPEAASLSPVPLVVRPANDDARIAALHYYQIVDSANEQVFDELVALVARLFRVPIALLSLVDREEVQIAANCGLPGGGRLDRAFSLCSTAILQDTSTVFEDFNANPCCLTDPTVARQLNLQFYAGHPLHTPDGYNIGMLCVIDHQPRPFKAAEDALLTALAGVAMRLVELRLALRQQASLSFDQWQPLYGSMSALFGPLSALSEPAPAASAALLETMCQEATAIAAILGEHLDTVRTSEPATAT
jgi:RNA polymerase sigma factor (sigma-70 family)